MQIIELSTPIHSSLSHKVSEFERLFTYPLGQDRYFRIDHSPNYDAFYKAMGEAHTYYALYHDKIVASISYVIRTVKLHDHIDKVAYLGDLKIHPDHQATRLFFSIAKHLQPILEREVSSAYGIVMDGTINTPEQYTGRLGIPKFERLKEVYVLRFDTKNCDTSTDSHISKESCFETYQNLSSKPFASISNSHMRSAIAREWFSTSKLACGMLEDTRLAKRLFLESGEELRSAHLSYFVYDDVQQGFLVIKSALKRSFQLGFPAMFLALSKQQMDDLESHLIGTSYSMAKAAIYGTQKTYGEITINTAEI
ncbi:MAG: GNAT family N-acetyltransferase [Rickettsiaceae bacterium]|nr:GNAT family N-acetyltransferase [Rickettsiaceae bacterium]